MRISQKSTNNLNGGEYRSEELGRWMSFNYSTLRENLATGMSLHKVAKRMGIPRITLWYRITRHAPDLVKLWREAKKSRAIARAPIVAMNVKKSKRDYMRRLRGGLLSSQERSVIAKKNIAKRYVRSS